ncbi:MAG TPA: CCA tRNA nucleotidyltransferase [Candidatus Dormibacteraeota bacterium]|jgi:poly(A) polymerase|nr:CCA tRNA nucleotidyltransferase [Candidatus Dormibacteraeota bacterium]
MRLTHQAGLEPLLAALREESVRLGARASLVGGYVRDRLLGRDCKDLDVVVERGAGLELARAVAARLGTREPVVFERFGTAQVAWGDFLVEFVSARAERYDPGSRKPDVRPGTLEEDIWRRDFTANALLSDFDGEVSDVTGLGLADLDARLLRTPLPARETFSEDPLRMVRAVRFAATLEFSLHQDIPPAIAACLPRLQPGTVVSVERITEELRRMLLSPHPGRALRLMRAMGMLAPILPEVEAMAGVEQTGFHDRDVLEHTLDALEATAPPRLTGPDLLVARLAVLFHDAGKPATAARDGDRVTFLGHPEVGAELAREALRRLRFSNEVVDAVARLVELHMRPVQYDPQGWSDGAVRRLVRDADELLPALLELTRVDTAASAYPEAEAARKLGDLEARIHALGADEVRRAVPPLTGDALMERFGRGPGPWIGRVQRALLDAVLDGDLPAGAGHEAEALEYLGRHPELVAE